MSAILSCPETGAHPPGSSPDTVEVDLGGLHLTIGLGSIAPARSMWFPEERILILDEALLAGGGR